MNQLKGLQLLLNELYERIFLIESGADSSYFLWYMVFDCLKLRRISQ